MRPPLLASEVICNDIDVREFVCSAEASLSGKPLGMHQDACNVLTYGRQLRSTPVLRRVEMAENCITFESSLHPFLDRYRLSLQGLLRPAQLTAQQVARRCGSGAVMLGRVSYVVVSRSTVTVLHGEVSRNNISEGPTIHIATALCAASGSSF